MGKTFNRMMLDEQIVELAFAAFGDFFENRHKGVAGNVKRHYGDATEN